LAKAKSLKILVPTILLFFGLFLTAAFQVLACLSTQGHDLTFFLAGDTHYGLSAKTAAYNRAVVDAMNSLPGTPYPPGTIPGTVKNPRGVAVLGDLVEEGEGEMGLEQWEEFTRDFGVCGEGWIDFPVYEGFGNHDGGAEQPVRQGIKLRNTQRAGLAHISKNGFHYSWNWEGIHFIQLNLFPGIEADRIINPWGNYFEGSWKEPLHSVDFLRADLEKYAKAKNQPIIILMHYGFDPYGLGWWSERERDVFYKTIKDYNILAIFWGHTHMVQSIEWRGIPTFCVGSTQKSNGPGEFLVVHITNGTMYIMERKLRRWGTVFKVEFSR
jgi:cytolysin (calcineurin-like family phosphatase)